MSELKKHVYARKYRGESRTRNNERKVEHGTTIIGMVDGKSGRWGAVATARGRKTDATLAVSAVRRNLRI